MCIFIISFQEKNPTNYYSHQDNLLIIAKQNYFHPPLNFVYI